MPHDDLPKEGGQVLTDQHVALYRDGQGQLHAISSVCTHRGCDVGWNDQAKTWIAPVTVPDSLRRGRSSRARPSSLSPRWMFLSRPPERVRRAAAEGARARCPADH